MHPGFVRLERDKKFAEADRNPSHTTQARGSIRSFAGIAMNCEDEGRFDPLWSHFTLPPDCGEVIMWSKMMRQQSAGEWMCMRTEVGANSAICQAFDYLYRDASNYKAFGTVYLRGTLTRAEQRDLVSYLESGEFFVAEQIGIPALRNFLLGFDRTPSEDDHVWHAFEGFRDNAPLPAGSEIWGESSALIAAFQAVNHNWQPMTSTGFAFSVPRLT
jgi:hypothetical protein